MVADHAFADVRRQWPTYMSPDVQTYQQPIYPASTSHSNSLLTPITPAESMPAPIDSSGLKVWPAASALGMIQPSVRPKLHRHAVSTPNYSRNYPNPSSWNTYGIYTPVQQQVTPQSGHPQHTPASDNFFDFGSIEEGTVNPDSRVHLISDTDESI